MSCRETSARWAVQYKLGEFVTPNVRKSRLLAFKTLKDAVSFSGSMDRIWKATATGVYEPDSGIQMPTVLHTEQFWSMSYDKFLSFTDDYHMVGHFPYNTLFCKSIRLDEELPNVKSR
jgi:hypothetical protein